MICLIFHIKFECYASEDGLVLFLAWFGGRGCCLFILVFQDRFLCVTLAVLELAL